MSWINILGAIWPVFAAIFGAIITGIVFYFSDKVKYINRVTSLEQRVAIQKEKIDTITMVTTHLTTAGESLKSELTGVYTLMGNIKTDVEVLQGFTKISVDHILLNLKEMKSDLKELGKKD